MRPATSWELTRSVLNSFVLTQLVAPSGSFLTRKVPRSGEGRPDAEPRAYPGSGARAQRQPRTAGGRLRSRSPPRLCDQALRGRDSVVRGVTFRVGKHRARGLSPARLFVSLT